MVCWTRYWFPCFAALTLFVSAIGARETIAKDSKPTEKAGADAKKNKKPTEKTDAETEKKKKPTEKADENSSTAKKDGAAATPLPTYTVKKSPFKVVVDIEGIFVAKTMHEILVKPEEWNALVVKNAVPHGQRVRKGDVLLTLDTEKIDQAIADVRAELKISEIVIRQGEDQLQALEKTTPLDLDSSRRSHRIAGEDKKYFAEVDRPFAVKLADFSLKMAEDALEYQQEELRQLEKMYKSDDITEETEEIVLKRARDAVEKAKFIVEYSKISRDQMLKLSIPRVGEMVEDAAQRKTVEWEKNKIELPLAVQKQRLELAKTRVQRERSDERFKRLLSDREAMTVKSPSDGIVYYGKCSRGKFGDSGGMGENLRPNNAIAPNQVLMTVVDPRPMFIRSIVPEAQLYHLRPGLKGVASPAGYPDLKLPVTLDDTSDVPVAPGSFDARLDVTLSRKAKLVMPGMACNVKLTPYLKKDAVSVLSKLVADDELDDAKHHVFVLGKDGKPEKRPVTLGEKTDKQTEILKGLAEGEKVLLEAPKDP